MIQKSDKNKISRPFQRKPLGGLFDFRNFVSLLVLRAVNIVEGLMNQKDFFAETFGAVLNKIGKHYNMAKLSREDLEKLREKILREKFPLIAGKNVKDIVYMHCYPKLQQIHIEGEVQKFLMFLC